MRKSSERRIDIGAFIGTVMARTNFTLEAIESELPKLIMSDRSLHNAISGELRRRLKYSTGRLDNALSINAYIPPSTTKKKIIKPKSGVHYELKKEVTEYQSELVVYFSLNSKDKNLINALLSEPELNSENVPSIGELTEWIIGKSRYFKAALDQKDRNIRALQMQRNILVNTPHSKGYKTINRSIQGTTSIKELAETIRWRMARRVENGLPSTKGSNFIFLGLYKSSLSSENDNKARFVPRYKEVETPLYTRDKKSMPRGVLNDIIDNCIVKHIKKELENMSYRMNKERIDSSQFYEIYGNRPEYLDYEIGTSDSFTRLNNIISIFRPGTSKKRKEQYEIGINLIKRSKELFISSQIDAANISYSYIKSCEQEIEREIKSFLSNVRKRPAIRRRGSKK